MPVARSWQGFATRWLGSQGSIPAVRDVADVAFPVIVVGQDACDEGGMMGASCADVPPAGTSLQLALTSARGFVLWNVRFRSSVAGGGFSMFAAVLPVAPTITPPLSPVSVLRALHDVTASASREPFPNPLNASALRFPIETPLVNNVVDMARPIVVPPNEWLVLVNNVNANVQEYTLLFEEGL